LQDLVEQVLRFAKVARWPKEGGEAAYYHFIYESGTTFAVLLSGI
jgi:hypothetical protein